MLMRLALAALALAGSLVLARADGLAPAGTAAQGLCYASGSSGARVPCVLQGQTWTRVLRPTDPADNLTVGARALSSLVLNALPSGRRAVELGQADDLTVVARGSLVSRALADRLRDPGVSVLDYGVGVGTGGDDSAAINAAIAAATGAGPEANGTVIFPTPPSGYYNVCASPMELPGATKGVTLSGQSNGTVAIRAMPGCTSGITSVLHRTNITGALTNTRVNIDNLTFDGWCITKYTANLEYSVATNITRSTFRNAKPGAGGANVRIGGGYEIYMDGTNRLENMNDPGHTCYNSVADMPDYNLETYASDSSYPGLIGINARIANFYSANGGNNRFPGTHGWGYQTPIRFVPQYNFLIAGNSDLSGCSADTADVAGIRLMGFPTQSDAKIDGCYVYGGKAGADNVQVDPGITHYSIVNNRFYNSGGGVVSKNSDGSTAPLHATALIANNYGAGVSSPVTATPIAGGDTAELTAYGAGGGVALNAKSAGANSGVSINAKGAAAVQLGSNGVLAFGAYANPAAVNSLLTTANSAGFAPNLQAIGSDTNIALALVGKGSGGVYGSAFSYGRDPTGGDLPDGFCADWINTLNGTTKRWCNISGTLKSIAYQ